MRSSNAIGIDGHQWNLHCASTARLPCRAMCECSWTSTAGQRIQVLLELKGHLEEALTKDMRPTSQDADMSTHRGAPSSLAGWSGAHNQGGDHDDL